MDPTNDDQIPRIYNIRRSQHLGYGFILGSEQPCIVKLIDPNGPSYGRLKPYDVILSINGIDVEHAPRDKVIKMIQLSDREIEITVRRATYEEEIRATNLANPRFYMFNKSQHNNYPDSLNEHPTQRKVSDSSPLPDHVSSHTQLNRLVTSIAQQQPTSRPTYPVLPCSTSQTNNLTHNGQPNYFTLQPDRSRKVLQQKTVEQLFESSRPDKNHKNCGNTLDRHIFNNKMGRHSPLPQRCKSSMDDTQIGRAGKKNLEHDKDLPMLKRSNTMRPIRPPAKVMEIFEVVIKIFFEDDQTKMLPYNQETTVGDVLETLKARLGSNAEQIKSYFGLAVTVNTDDSSDTQQLANKKPFHVLDEDHPIMGIRKLPYAPKLRLLYRMIYPPSDIFRLFNQSKVAFEYLYKQSCNDLRLERFSPALDADPAIKLAALYLVEYVYSNHPKAHGNSKDPKVYLKLVKKDPGLRLFVPRTLYKATEDKKGKRVISQYRRLKTRLLEQLKKNFDEIDFEPPTVKSTTNINRYTTTSFHELALPELQCSLSDHVKLIFLNHLKEMPCFKSTEREKPSRTSVSPIDQSSVGDCSSSMESVPRTSDSSPLIRQSRGQNGQPALNGYPEQSNINVVTRLAQMNSMRSMSSLQTGHNGVNGTLLAQDQPDMAQTPSIESISSITFNMQSTPSPQQASSHPFAQNEPRGYPFEPSMGTMRHNHASVEPMPMPRHMTNLQTDHSNLKSQHTNKMDFYNFASQPIDELISKAILPPPPSIAITSPLLFPLMRSGRDLQQLRHGTHLTPILTEKDLEGLKVPPPPK